MALALLLVVGFLVLLGRAGSWARLRGEGWRVGLGMAALVVLALAAYLILRRAWLPGAALLVIGTGLANSARGPGRTMAQPPAEGISRRQALSILGLEEGADRSAVQAAYARLMRKAHPDAGGTAGLAAQINAARDVLLKS